MTFQPQFRTLFMHGVVHIEGTVSLDETAQLLSQALATTFFEDREGKYEEFPAWTASVAGLEFALLGIPLPAHDHRVIRENTYELQIHSDRGIFPEGAIEHERFHAVELSEFYARLIRARTNLSCTPSEYPGAA